MRTPLATRSAAPCVRRSTLWPATRRRARRWRSSSIEWERTACRCSVCCRRSRCRCSRATCPSRSTLPPLQVWALIPPRSRLSRTLSLAHDRIPLSSDVSSLQWRAAAARGRAVAVERLVGQHASPRRGNGRRVCFWSLDCRRSREQRGGAPPREEAWRPQAHVARGGGCPSEGQRAASLCQPFEEQVRPRTACSHIHIRDPTSSRTLDPLDVPRSTFPF